MRTKFESALRVATTGAFWVLVTSLAIVATITYATWYWWCQLSVGDTATNVLWNMALIGGGLIAWVFAYWRSSIASQQAEIAKQEHYHARFQKASGLLALPRLDNSHSRISGLHAFRYLVHDAPDLGVAAIEVITSFMIQTPIDDNRDLREFTLARMTAEFCCDSVDRARVFDAASRERLRKAVDEATAKVERKFREAGLDPFGAPE